MTYKQWLVQCKACEQSLKLWGWNTEFPLLCPMCNGPTELWVEAQGQSASVIADSIPGGVVIRHLGPTPETFYSHTDIKRAANERGWTRNGDTPKPYKVNWSGRAKS